MLVIKGWNKCPGKLLNDRTQTQTLVAAAGSAGAVPFQAEGRSPAEEREQEDGTRLGGSPQGFRSRLGQEVVLLVDRTGQGVARSVALGALAVGQHSYRMRVEEDHGDPRAEEQTRLAWEAGFQQTWQDQNRQ